MAALIEGRVIIHLLTTTSTPPNNSTKTTSTNMTLDQTQPVAQLPAARMYMMEGGRGWCFMCMVGGGRGWCFMCMSWEEGGVLNVNGVYEYEAYCVCLCDGRHAVCL